AKDFVKSFRLMRKSADIGLPLGCYSLATYFARGIGCDKDMKAAVKWMRRAAKLGGMWAMESLSKLYETGVEGVMERDANKALFWQKKYEEHA
ncbi:MAG: hypothetical protein SGILL_008631, partial [Bacillariaceae sp.]